MGSTLGYYHHIISLSMQQSRAPSWSKRLENYRKWVHIPHG